MTRTASPSAPAHPAQPAATTQRTSSRYSRVAVLLHWLTAALVLFTIPLGLFSTATPGAAPAGAVPAVPAPPGAVPAVPAPPGAVPAVPAPPAAVPAVPAPPAAAAPRTLQPGAAPMAPGASAARKPPPPKTPAQQTATNLHKTVGVVILLLTVLRLGWRLAHRPPPLPAAMAVPLRALARTSHTLFYGLLLVMPLSGWWMSSAVPSPRRHAFGFGIFDIPFLPVPQGWPQAAAAKAVHVNLVWLMVALIALHVLAALKHHFIDKDDVLLRMLPRKA